MTGSGAPAGDPFLLLRSDDGVPVRPLRVLVTRPADQADESAALVRAAGGEPLLFPCLKAAPPLDEEPLRAALRELEHFDAIAVTSAQAVAPIATALATAGSGRPLVAAVGPRTAAALREHGIPADLVGTSDGADLATRLLTELAARRGGAPGARVLLPQAEEARDELLTALQAAAVETRVVIAYRMVAATATELDGLVAAVRDGAADLLPLTSPRTAQIVLGALGPDAAPLLLRLRVGALGSTTTSALRAAGVRVDVVPPRPTYEALLRALAALPSRR